MDSDGPAIAASRPDGSLELSNGSTLRPREVEVLRLIAHGLRNREIAERLFVSVHTVEYHAANLYQKLDARNRTEAGLRAARLGIVEGARPEGEGLEGVLAPNIAAKLPESRVPGMGPAPTVRLALREGSLKMLERIRTLFAGNHILAVPRAAVLTGLLVVLLASAAKVTATFDLDEKLIGRRLDTWAMGHPDPLHCTSPADAEIDRAKNAYPPVGREPPKDLILMQFHGQKVTGLPGTLCFRSEAELFEHFGKDPERRFCVRTETNPTGLDEVTRIPLTEPLPPDGARCFRTFDDVAAHFGFEP